MVIANLNLQAIREDEDESVSKSDAPPLQSVRESLMEEDEGCEVFFSEIEIK